MSTTTTKDGRFRIDYHERSDDSYMYSYTSESWKLFSVELDEELMSFSGTWNADSTGDAKDGISDVRFSDDETAILVRDYKDQVKRVPLPVSFRLSEDERFLIHVHRDGHETQTALHMEFSDDSDAVPHGFRAEIRKDEAKRIRRIKQALAKGAAKT